MPTQNIKDDRFRMTMNVKDLGVGKFSNLRGRRLTRGAEWTEQSGRLESDSPNISYWDGERNIYIHLNLLSKNCAEGRVLQLCFGSVPPV